MASRDEYLCRVTARSLVEPQDRATAGEGLTAAHLPDDMVGKLRRQSVVTEPERLLGSQLR